MGPVLTPYALQDAKLRGRVLTLCSVSVSAWFLSNWCKAWLWGRGWSDSLGGSQSNKKICSSWSSHLLSLSQSTQSLTLHLECLNQVSLQGCTSLRTGLWRLPQCAGDIPSIPGLTAWVATGPQAVGTQQTLGHSLTSKGRGGGVFFHPASHGNHLLSHEPDDERLQRWLFSWLQSQTQQLPPYPTTRCG